MEAQGQLYEVAIRVAAHMKANKSFYTDALRRSFASLRSSPPVNSDVCHY